MKGTLRSATALPNHRPRPARTTTRAPAITSALLALVLLGAAVTLAQTGEDTPPVDTECPPGSASAPPPHEGPEAGNGTNTTTGAPDPACTSEDPAPGSTGTNETPPPYADDGFGTQPVQPCPCHHPDLAVALEAELQAGGYGEDGRLDYRISLTNVGEAPAEDAVVASELPDLGGNWSLAGANGSSCAVTNLSLRCAFAEVVPGEILRVVVSSAVCAMDCASVVHTVTAHAPDDDEPANDSASAVVERSDCGASPSEG